MAKPLHELAAFTADGDLRVVIETPKGSRNKYAYESQDECFALRVVLPEGSSFPYDFGMIPSTRGKDGDPLDILLVMDAPAFPGCVIDARIVGAIEAEQEEDGAWTGNDRLIGVAVAAHGQAHVRDIADLHPTFLDEVEAFFEQYNRLNGRRFRPKGRIGAGPARALVDEAVEARARD